MGVCIPDGSSFCCVNADTWKTVANPCSNAAEPLCLTPGSELVAFADSSETIPCQAAQNGIVVVGATGSCAAPSGLSQTEGLVAGCCKPFVGTTCMTSFKTCPPGVGSGRACMLATGDVSDAGDNSNGACLPQTGADACCVDFAEFEGSTADNCNGVLCRDQNYDPPRFLVNRPGVSFTCNPNNGELDEFFTWGCDPSRGEGFIATCCTVAPSG
ncbi:hypothetical protein DFJ74DRAFT_652846 [Hyaloraphidium curvatum]|nr:hypothetical protein DFJ74DRAFT_652846 [Hyaloraphidium curvatum]